MKSLRAAAAYARVVLAPGSTGGRSFTESAGHDLYARAIAFASIVLTSSALVASALATSSLEAPATGEGARSADWPANAHKPLGPGDRRAFQGPDALALPLIPGRPGSKADREPSRGHMRTELKVMPDMAAFTRAAATGRPIDALALEPVSPENAGRTVVVVEESDWEPDGRIDLRFAITNEYDRQGRVVRWALDRDWADDESFQDEHQATTTEYDARGNVVRVTQQAGEYHAVTTFEHDSKGNMVRADLETNWYRATYRIEYDGRGSAVLVEFDFGSDGTVDQRTTCSRTYDGARIVQVVMDDDYDADGAIDVRHAQRFDYDPWGHVTHSVRDEDHDADGLVERRETQRTEFASWGDVVHGVFESDLNADGIVDGRYESRAEYDHRRGLTRWANESDQNADGSIDRREAGVCEFDQNGRLVLRDAGFVNSYDPSNENRYVERYAYDARGLMTEREVEGYYQGSVYVRVITTFVYNGGNLAESMTLTDFADWISRDWSFRSMFGYDSRGHVVRIVSEADYDGDGAWDPGQWLAQFEYDGQGDLVLEVHNPGTLPDGAAVFGFRRQHIQGGSGSFAKLESGGKANPSGALAVADGSPAPGRDPEAMFLRPVDSSSGSLTLEFSLGGSEPARLEAFDVSGRRIASREVGVGGQGRRTESLGSQPAGLYLVRLSQAGRSRTSRVMLVH